MEIILFVNITKILKKNLRLELGFYITIKKDQRKFPIRKLLWPFSFSTN